MIEEPDEAWLRENGATENEIEKAKTPDEFVPRFMIPCKVASISEDGFTLTFTSDWPGEYRISTDNLPFPYFPPLSVGDEVGIYFAMGDPMYFAKKDGDGARPFLKDGDVRAVFHEGEQPFPLISREARAGARNLTDEEIEALIDDAERRRIGPWSEGGGDGG